MNTIRSVGYGWAVLIVAGGGSYYFAKRSINADRAERAAADELRRQQRERQRYLESAEREQKLGTRRTGVISAEQASENSDAASSGPGLDETRSKYEAAEVFRSRKGDRFS